MYATHGDHARTVVDALTRAGLNPAQLMPDTVRRLDRAEQLMSAHIRSAGTDPTRELVAGLVTGDIEPDTIVGAVIDHQQQTAAAKAAVDLIEQAVDATHRHAYTSMPAHRDAIYAALNEQTDAVFARVPDVAARIPGNIQTPEAVLDAPDDAQAAWKELVALARRWAAIREAARVCRETQVDPNGERATGRRRLPNEVRDRLPWHDYTNLGHLVDLDQPAHMGSHPLDLPTLAEAGPRIMTDQEARDNYERWFTRFRNDMEALADTIGTDRVDILMTDREARHNARHRADILAERDATRAAAGPARRRVA